MVRRFDQCSSQHRGKLRRWIGRKIESRAGARLFAVFAATLPFCFALLDRELLLDRRFHVIVAAPVVFGWYSLGIQFPCRYSVLAAPAIVIRIFRPRGTS